MSFDFMKLLTYILEKSLVSIMKNTTKQHMKSEAGGAYRNGACKKSCNLENHVTKQKAAKRMFSSQQTNFRCIEMSRMPPSVLTSTPDYWSSGINCFPIHQNIVFPLCRIRIFSSMLATYARIKLDLSSQYPFPHEGFTTKICYLLTYFDAQNRIERSFLPNQVKFDKIHFL